MIDHASLRVKYATHDVDGCVVAIEMAGGGDKANRVFNKVITGHDISCAGLLSNIRTSRFFGGMLPIISVH